MVLLTGAELPAKVLANVKKMAASRAGAKLAAS
jgi:hypothetical protein